LGSRMQNHLRALLQGDRQGIYAYCDCDVAQ
jgi:hypothetical protein